MGVVAWLGMYSSWIVIQVLETCTLYYKTHRFFFRDLLIPRRVLSCLVMQTETETETEQRRKDRVFSRKRNWKSAADTPILIGLAIFGLILAVYAGFMIVNTASGIAIQSARQFNIPSTMTVEGVPLAYTITIGVLGLIPLCFVVFYLNDTME